MKKLLLLVLVILLANATFSFAQTNIFPATGNAGVGTTSPSKIFTIRSFGSDTTTLRLEAKNAPAAYFTEISNLHNGAEPFNIKVGSLKLLTLKSLGVGATDGEQTSVFSGYSSLGLSTGSFTPTASSIRLFINNIGNVGIGNTAPDAKFRVTSPNADFRIDYNGAGQNYYDASNYHSFRDNAGNNKLLIYSNLNATHSFNNFTIFTKTGTGLAIQNTNTTSEWNYTSLVASNSVRTHYYGSDPSKDFIIGSDDAAKNFKITNFKNILIDGNMGIGTTAPTEKLEINGNLLLSGTAKYGNSGVRTESRNNAGLQGNAGAMSGFYETYAPENFPKDAGSWWHLIDTRHSNNTNNYAMQLAGSFFDQKLYFRKTNGSPTQAWREVITADPSGEMTIGKSDYTGGSLFFGNANYGIKRGYTVNGNDVGFYTTSGDLYLSTTNSTPQFVLKNSGNVGIGTTTPTAKLEVNSSAIEVALFRGTSDAAAFRFHNDINKGITLSTYKSDYPTTQGSPFGIGANGSIMVQTANAPMAVGTWEVAQPLLLGTSSVERMRIAADGNIGIGTKTPVANLEVVGSENSGIRLSGNTSRLTFTGSKTNLWNIDNFGGTLRFFREDYSAGTAGANGFERMVIKDNGNVGIGTANPSAKLEIASTTGSGLKLSGLSQTNVQAGATRTLGVNDAGEVVIAGNINATSSKQTDLNGYKTFYTNGMSAVVEQAKRYEIARIFTDPVNWNYTAPVEIELQEGYYASGASRKYKVYFGYLNKDGVVNQVEVNDIVASSGAVGVNNFQLTIGTPVTDGTNKYLPIYADVKYYATVKALIKTARTLSANNTGGISGSIYVNTEPTGTNIPVFVPNNNTEFATAGGNSIFSGNVGIGTTTPDANFKLHIKGVHGNTSTLLQLPANANGANTGEISLNTWVSEPNISWEGTGIGANINNWGLTRYNTAMSSSYVRFVPHPTNGYMLFSTIAGNGTKYNNVMAIVNDKIGIGTDAPSEKLSVVHNGTNTPFGAMGIDVGSFSTNANAANSYFFRVRDIGANSTPFIINGNGNVGIGTTTPAYKLAVAGTIYSDNAMFDKELPLYGYGARVAAYGQNGDVGIAIKREVNTPSSWWIRTPNNSTDLDFFNGGTAMKITASGGVAISTTTIPAGYKLAIGGDMIAERVVVKLQANWPDYVFKTGYSLRPLSEVESFVKLNNHLPDVPSEAEVKAKGIDMEQMNATLLKKVEELTLYMIELQKQNDVLKKRMDSLDKK
jgi:hypothetical protein